MDRHNLEDIAEWAIGDETYSREEIMNLPPHYLIIEIRSNNPSVLRCEKLTNGNMEQRQFSIFEIVKKVCSNYKIPDLIFGYCGYDRSPDLNGPFFTHSRLRGIKTRNILAPCFTFYGYPERNPEVIKLYTDSWSELVRFRSEKKIEWKDKRNTCVFVGSVSDYNNRLDNTTLALDETIDLEIINQPADSKNFITRESLSKYKFLLHLNGNGGAYASRLKYLLGTGGLIIYNYNSGNESNFWEEWWMNEDLFIDGFHFISVNNKFECEKALLKYSKNESDAEMIANNGYKFFEEFLNPEKVEEYWFYLLKAYSKKLK